MSNAAAKAWVAVAAIGAVVVLLVLVLALIPRLTGGQEVLDAAAPAMTDDQVAGERAGVEFLSRYVDLADPLVTARGGAREAPTLIRLVARHARLSQRRARAALRRTAPRTAALLRALPLSAITLEAPALQSFLTQTLNMSSAELQAALGESFPRLSEALSALVLLGNAWNEIPRPFQRFDGTPVRTVPGLRDYLRDDLVAAVADQKENFQQAQSKGGIGYIPWLLLIVGLGLVAYGLRQAVLARRSGPRGRRQWGVVAAVGIVLLGLVVVLSYVPRMSAAEKVTDAFEPAFTQERVAGADEGIELVHDAIRFGDAVVTSRGAAAEVSQLTRYVSERTGLGEGQVLRRLRRSAPRTGAMLAALPLQAVGDEQRRLMRFLGRRMRMSQRRLLLTLRKHTPGLARALESTTAVTTGWNAIPGTEKLERFDGRTPVRTMPALDDYLRLDVISVLSDEREHFQKLAGTWPPLTVLPPLLLVVGALVLLYGLYRMRGAPRHPA